MPIIIKVVDSQIRLDKYLVQKTNFNRSTINKLIDNNLILINNKLVTKSGQLVNIGDEIIINDIEQKQETKIEPYQYDLDIKYEDDDLIIINKPSGMLTHASQYNEQDTLMNALVYYSKNKWMPLIIHRLDKDTSGLIIIAKNQLAQEKMLEIFQERKIIKKYYALVKNKVTKTHFMIDVPISRANDNKLKMIAGIAKNKKEALTEVNLINSWDNYSLLDVILHTGRTHQIRVHLQYIKHPIVNDPLYNSDHSNSDYNQYLMSYYLKFNHPINKKEIEIKIDLDDEFKQFINKLEIK